MSSLLKNDPTANPGGFYVRITLKETEEAAA
jgi:hypothetical protein